MVRVCAGAKRRELDTSDILERQNVAGVEFTDSAHGQASQGTRHGMGPSPVSLVLWCLKVAILTRSLRTASFIAL